MGYNPKGCKESGMTDSMDMSLSELQELVMDRVLEDAQLQPLVEPHLAVLPDVLQLPLVVQHQYSCLENPMDTGAWWAIVHGVTKSWT